MVIGPWVVTLACLEFLGDYQIHHDIHPDYGLYQGLFMGDRSWSVEIVLNLRWKKS